MLQTPLFHSVDNKLAILAKLDEGRIREISKMIKRVDGEVAWNTSATEILQEFCFLSQSTNVASLSYVLHAAYDLYDVIADDVELSKIS